MSNSEPPLIEETNLLESMGKSTASSRSITAERKSAPYWYLSQISLMASPKKTLTSDGNWICACAVRESKSVHTVAKYSFPRSLYRLAGYNRERAFTLCSLKTMIVT